MCEILYYVVAAMIMCSGNAEGWLVFSVAFSSLLRRVVDAAPYFHFIFATGAGS